MGAPFDRTESIITAGSQFEVQWRGEPPLAGDRLLLDWVRRSAAIVRGYYGGFPARRVAIRVTITDGARVMSGHTSAWPSALIDVTVGRGIGASALEDDWVLVHEMIHLALPDVGPTRDWLAEGIATYVEGVARVKAGNLSPEGLWLEYVEEMPKGVPASADQGLDRTHSWASTYWGGALFCLLADVRIREATGGRYGLEDALRAVWRESGGMAAEWPVTRVFEVGDAATGTRVLSELYAAARDAPMRPDLGALWSELGVERTPAGVALRDDRPLSSVRRAITAARSAPAE